MYEEVEQEEKRCELHLIEEKTRTHSDVVCGVVVCVVWLRDDRVLCAVLSERGHMREKKTY